MQTKDLILLAVTLLILGEVSYLLACLPKNSIKSKDRAILVDTSVLMDGRKFLMLDEFAADLDPQFRAEFYERILPELKSRGYTIFAISHDDKYFGAADKIYKMQRGEILRIK